MRGTSCHHGFEEMAPLSSSVFLFFEMLLAVSASYSVSGLYGGVSYQPVEHHALRGQSFRDISGISAVLCSARCLSHHGCFSFNYDHINRVCQMNNVTRQQKCDHFQRMQSFTYYDATAKPRNCQVVYLYAFIKLNKIVSNS